MPAQDAVTFKHHTIHSPARQLIPRILVNRRITGDLLIRDGIKIHFGTGKRNVNNLFYLVEKVSVSVRDYLHTFKRAMATSPEIFQRRMPQYVAFAKAIPSRR